MLRTFMSRDSNVALAADETTFSGERVTTVFGAGLSGDYRLYRDAEWTFGATGTALQTYNADGNLRDFNLTSVAPGLVARRAFRVNDRPAALTMNYAAHRAWLGGSGFSSGHQFAADVGVRPSFTLDLGAFGGVGYTEFDDQGPSPASSSRDAISYRGGLRAAKSFNRNRQAIQASLMYVKNDAKGANFVFEGPAANLQFTSYLVGPWAVAVGVGYSSVEYTNYEPLPRRESTSTDYRLTVFGPLSKKLGADVSFSRSQYGSNQSAFRADRENITLGLTYSF